MSLHCICLPVPWGVLGLVARTSRCLCACMNACAHACVCACVCVFVWMLELPAGVGIGRPLRLCVRYGWIVVASLGPSLWARAEFHFNVIITMLRKDSPSTKTMNSQVCLLPKLIQKSIKIQIKILTCCTLGGSGCKIH